MGNRLRDVSKEKHTEHSYNPEIVSNATDNRGMQIKSISLP